MSLFQEGVPTDDVFWILGTSAGGNGLGGVFIRGLWRRDRKKNMKSKKELKLWLLL